jgi:hypothetical protein
MTTKRKFSKAFLELLKQVQGKRARIVVGHILEHGYITTEELETLYGYKHPPRAVRDVREQGIPLETFSVKSGEGRTIAAYRFADPAKVRQGRLGGRRVFPKAFKHRLFQASNGKCSICLIPYRTRYLQVDHRVPYEISGDPVGGESAVADFMLLCGSCNRAKSWSCEHCPNWLEEQNPEICRTCYWAYPESYKHIALRPVRRLDIVWTDHEVEVYERLKRRAEQLGQEMPEYVKIVIKEHLSDH